MEGRLKDRIAIVTGSSSGLGRSIACVYADSGARVVCADLKPTGSPLPPDYEIPKATHELIQEKHGESAACFIEMDVTVEASVKDLIQKAVKWGGKLDIMVNNAGVLTESEETGELGIQELPEEGTDKVIGINVRGVWLGCKYAVEQLLKQEPNKPNYRGDIIRGWIINTASILGLIAFKCTPTFTPTKRAIVGLTKQVAADHHTDRIHCNCLLPGSIQSAVETEMLRSPQETEKLTLPQVWSTMKIPDNIARAALFLATEDASAVNGRLLVADGNYTIM